MPLVIACYGGKSGLLTNIDRSLLEKSGFAKVKRSWKLWKVRVPVPSDRMFNGEDNELDQKIATDNGERE